MIELFAWTGLVISLLLMVYHRYMAANHEQVYTYISKKYGEDGDLKHFPSKNDHEKDANKYSRYTAICALILIILNVVR